MQTGRHFLSSCSEVNRTGYPEFDEPISVRHQRYPLFFIYPRNTQAYSNNLGLQFIRFSSWILCNLKVISLKLFVVLSAHAWDVVSSLRSLLSLVSGLDSIFRLLIASTNQLYASPSSGFGQNGRNNTE